MAKVAIHGFGRIGRTALRIALQNNLFVPVSISDIRDAQTFAALFEVDTNYGRWHEKVTATDNSITVGGREIAYFNSKDSLPDWGALGVDLVIDCTGRATTRAGAQPHLDRGAKRVLVSGPSKTIADSDAVLLPGINLDSLRSGQAQDHQHGELHHQRPRASRQGAGRKLRHRNRPLHNGSRLHQQPVAHRPADEGSPRTRGRRPRISSPRRRARPRCCS